MITLEVLWWIGCAWFAACVALPLLAVPLVGPVLGVVIWALLAPWSALIGMAGVHRLLPRSEEGTFHPFRDRGSINWALKGWAPSMYLTVFQPLYFMNQGFQRAALRCFGARIGSGAWLTSRTIIREPHRLRLGEGSVVGEFVHLVCSYQPRPGVLVVGDIDIGDRALIGAYTHVGPGVRIGAGSRLEHGVRVGGHSTVGRDCRIGEGSSIYNSVCIGNDVMIGKGCRVPSGSTIPDQTLIPDGMAWVSLSPTPHEEATA